MEVELPWGGPEPERERRAAPFIPEAGGKGRAAVDGLLGVAPAYVPENLALA
ncbi:hypothetical protein [Streptomyces sp. NPDC001927]